MAVSNLIRWSGLAAMIAGALFIIINLVTLLVLGFSPERVTSFNLLVRSVIAPLGGTLLLLGLVGIYFRESEAIGVLGLTSFLCAFFGTVLMQAGNSWAGWLANLGLALFGVAILRVQAYSRIAIILLVISAAITGMVSPLLSSGPVGVLVYVASVGANLIFNVAIVWLGFNLFMRRSDTAYQPSQEH